LRFKELNTLSFVITWVNLRAFYPRVPARKSKSSSEADFTGELFSGHSLGRERGSKTESVVT
jgi:hypothetical protein